MCTAWPLGSTEWRLWFWAGARSEASESRKFYPKQGPKCLCSVLKQNEDVLEQKTSGTGSEARHAPKQRRYMALEEKTDM